MSINNKGFKTNRSQKLSNPPGLDALKYRIGTYSTFKSSMLKRISHEKALLGLTTRNNNDLIISLIDAWAIVADVITFYQERIVNEGFIRTASDRLSVLELAQLLGYELSPGVAAHTYLAFTLDTTPETSENSTIIKKGTRIQSLPRQGEVPQTFEMTYDIEAYPQWNELLPRVVQPQVLDYHEITNDPDPHIYLNKINPQIKPGSKLLISLSQGPVMNSTNVYTLIVATVSKLDNNDKCLYFDIMPLISTRKTRDIATNNLNDTQKGQSNKDSNTLVYEILINIGRAFSMEISGENNDGNNDPKKKFGLMFNEEIEDLATKDWHQNDLVALAAKNHLPRRKFFELYNFEAQKIVHKKVTDYNSIDIDNGIYLLNIKASLFGHNAPAYDSLPKIIKEQGGRWNEDWDASSNSMDIKRFYYRINAISGTTNTNDTEVKIYLDNSYQNILPKSWIVLHDTKKDIAVPYAASKILEKTIADFLLSSKVSEISLTSFEPESREKGLAKKDNITDDIYNPSWNSFMNFKLRQTSVYAQSQKIQDLASDRPILRSDAKGQEECSLKNRCVVLNHVVDGLSLGQPVCITGCVENGSDQNVVSEIAIIEDVDLANDKYHTKITFTDCLRNKYDIKTLKINANVAYATHGQTTEEIVGSGDPSQKHQEFTLKQKPLTYLPSPQKNGVQSTLEIHVNDILWNEVSSFNTSGPKDRVYLVRIENSGDVHILFGDGLNGSRLPAGIDNVKAKYRVGLGIEGLLKKDQLVILMDRPLGVKNVTNPEDTAGAEEPEGIDSASNNASKTTVTMGRLVSLFDFENFALSFPNVGKAKAFDVSMRDIRMVSVTVASSLGQTVNENSDLYRNLKNAIYDKKDPLTAFRLDTFKPKLFGIKATIQILKTEDPISIKKQIENVLHEKFSFAYRDFGQDVKKDDILNAIQEIEGVYRISSISLNDSNKPDSPQDWIGSSGVEWEQDVKGFGTDFFSQAELLMIHPDSGPKAVDITIVVHDSNVVPR